MYHGLKIVITFAFVLGLCGIVFKDLPSQVITENFTKPIIAAFQDLGSKEFYLALANPNIAYIRVQEGMRKEQIVALMEKKLSWNGEDVLAFSGFDYLRDKKEEGKFFPDVYLLPKDMSGADLKRLMLKRFDEKVSSSIETDLEKSNLNIDTVLTIASIIQREAAGAHDMNLISGVIWNRLFKGMSLQMDATLQYAKGNETLGWWPRVVPKDKYIVSPYNTYKIKGLPPAPIANPGLASIRAALHPAKTPYLFYFHKNRKIYPSKTYAEHKRQIDLYLK